MYEQFFQCPYCWEEISILLDPSIQHQQYIEDCEICCNPMEIEVDFEGEKITRFRVQSIEQ